MKYIVCISTNFITYQLSFYLYSSSISLSTVAQHIFLHKVWNSLTSTCTYSLTANTNLQNKFSHSQLLIYFHYERCCCFCWKVFHFPLLIYNNNTKSINTFFCIHFRREKINFHFASFHPCVLLNST